MQDVDPLGLNSNLTRSTGTLPPVRSVLDRASHVDGAVTRERLYPVIL